MQVANIIYIYNKLLFIECSYSFDIAEDLLNFKRA